MRFAAFVLLLACTASAETTDQALQREIEAFEAWFGREWPNQLYDSENAEHLLVGALLTQRPTAESSHSPESFFAKALTRDPANPLILFDAAAYCLGDSRSAFCEQSFLHRLTEIDGENGAAWALRALDSQRRGDTAAALEHLRRAATSKDFDEYFMRHMTVFDQALRAWRAQPTVERFTLTIGLAASVANQGSGILLDCRERAAADSEWRHECLRLGTAMERHARTELTTALGQSLQIAMLELATDAEALAEAKARRDMRRARSYDRTNEPFDSLLANDGFWNEYFFLFVTQGEEAARERAVQRANELVGENALKQ